MKNKPLALILGIIGAGLVIIYYNFNPASSTSFFPSCPTYTIFRLYCPGCGTQRTIHYLLHGEVSTAMQYNPMFVLFLPLSLALILQYLLSKFTPYHWDIKLVRNNTFLYIIFAVICLYFILRNIPLDSLDFLRPPETAL